MNNAINDGKLYTKDTKLEKEPVANIYNLGFGILIIYILFKIIKKHN